MTNYQTYKEERAVQFVAQCERAGIYFTVHDSELCAIMTAESCGNISMLEFSRLLGWLTDEITEIVMRKSSTTRLKLVALNGRPL